MIKQLQMGFKLLKYTHGIKMSLILGVVMLVMGVSMEGVFGPADFTINNMGSYFILITAMWPLQMLISLAVPDYVSVSPWKKKIQTSVFAISSFIYYLVSYLLVLAVKLIRYRRGIVTAQELSLELLTIAAFIIVVSLYMAACLKYFAASTVIFCIGMPVVMMGSMVVLELDFLLEKLPSPMWSMVIGFAAVLLSAILSYGLLLLLYKKPVSKYSQMSGLRKKM